MVKRRRFLLGIGIGLVGAAVYLVLTTTQGARFLGQSPSRVTEQSVTVVVAKREDIDRVIPALGTVVPNATVTVRSRVDGQLDKIYFRDGQMVRVGQRLAQLDPRPFEAQLAQAEGQLARDKALLENAQLDLARYKTLLQQNSIAQQQVDTQAALVRQYAGAVRVDDGIVASARLQLTYSRISAPVSGVLGIRHIDEGNMIHATDATGLVVITQTQPSFVTFSLPENSMDAVLAIFRSGAPMKVDAWDRDEKVQLASGVLSAIDNQIDTTTGTIKLKAHFDNKDAVLFPNRFVNVKLHLATLRQVVVLPETAVQRGKSGCYVFVLNKDQSVSIRNVAVGMTEKGRTVIERGMQPGERVVLDGTDRLREGSRVRAVAQTMPS